MMHTKTKKVRFTFQSESLIAQARAAQNNTTVYETGNLLPGPSESFPLLSLFEDGPHSPPAEQLVNNIFRKKFHDVMWMLRVVDEFSRIQQQKRENKTMKEKKLVYTLTLSSIGELLSKART